MVQPSVEIRTITPAEAMSILEKNTANRNVRKRRVDSYARDMKNHNWHLNGDPIRFNSKGTLLDGQHRLLACIMAGVPFTSVVVTGIKEQAHPTIDIGAGRTLGDELKWRGEKNATNLSAALMAVWAYDNNQITGLATATRAEALALLDREPEIRDVIDTRKVAEKIAIMPSAFIASMHILRREHGPEIAAEYLQHLESGTDYKEGDPCLALRTYATSVASSRTLRPLRAEWMAVIIKSMNAYLLGRPVRYLRWRRVGASAESFPRLIDKEDLT